MAANVGSTPTRRTKSPGEAKRTTRAKRVSGSCKPAGIELMFAGLFSPAR